MAEHIGTFAARTAFVNAQVNGANDVSVVAAVAGHRIVVDYIMIGASATASAFLESSTTTVIFPTVYIAAGTSLTIDDPTVKTAVGESLTFSSTVTGNISIFVKYHLVPTYT